MFALYLMFISCSEKDNQNPIEVEEENQEEIDDIEEENIEDALEEAHGFCTPQPNLKTQTLGFDVFQKMIDVEEQSCFLAVREIDSDNDGYSDSSEEFAAPSSMTECEDENNCVQILPSFAVSWTQSFRLNPDLYTYGSLSKGIVEGERVISDGLETIALRVTYNIYGNTAEREIARIYSREGNILEERFFFNGTLWFEVRNTWENGLLVAQDAYDHINHNGTLTELRWSYDEQGRMVQSVYAPQNQQVSTGSFTYDDVGQLVEVRRDVDGELLLKQNWNYDNGELVSRSSEYMPAQWYTSADTAHGQTAFDYSSHWNSSLVTTEEGCTKLPYSIVHGYPDEEKVYQLGWQLSDVPNNVGFAYQYDGYGWNYGTLSWFGHMGVASIYDTSEWNGDTMRKNTITYQNGRMVTEVIAISNEEDQPSITRNRTFEGDRMITDEVVNTHTASPEIQNLEFFYDEQGKIETRNLYLDGVHTHHNTWTYNEEGHLTEHNISMLLPQNDALTRMASYRQTVVEDENSYSRIREKRIGDEETWELVDQLTKGEHERGRYESTNNNYVVFDDDHHIVMQGYGEIDDSAYYFSAMENQNGLLESWTQGEYDEVAVHHYQYTCD